jgi:hypothetical protein
LWFALSLIFFYGLSDMFSAPAEAPAMQRAPERKPVYEGVTPTKAPGVKSPRPYPGEEVPVAKQPKLQEADDRYRAELQMQVGVVVSVFFSGV